MSLSAARSRPGGAISFSALAAVCLTLALALAPPLRADEVRSLVEVRVPTEAEEARLRAAGFDVAGVNRKARTAGVVARAADLGRLEAMGFPFTLVDVSHPLVRRGEALDDYTNPAEMDAFIDQTVAAYPDLVRKVVLKETLHEGQKQLAVKITAGVNGDHDRPAFLLDAQHHAREVMTPEIAKDAIGYLTSNYGKDPRVTEWLDNIEVWVVPSANPDGAMYIFDSDFMWRRNRNPSCPVDLNRNYDWNWDACGGSSDLCAWDTYHGTGPNSEPETQGIVALVDQVRPMFSLSYHSYGLYILYPYGCGNPGERAVYDDLGFTLNGILQDDDGAVGNYATGPGWSTIYRTDGSSDDTLYGRFGAFAFVIEVNCCSFQPDYAEWRDVTVERQRTAWQYFLDKTLTYPSVQGRVTDATTGEALLANVSLQEVALEHGETPRRASATGRFGWPVQGGQTYHAIFSAPGYITQTLEVAVGSGPARLDVQMVSTEQAAIPRDPNPSDRAINQGQPVSLTWESDGATGYEVYFGTTTAPPLLGTVTAQSYAVPSVETGKTYYWQIIAVGPWGKTPGPLWSFSTHPFAVTAVKKLGNPFRLQVEGQGFASTCTVVVDGSPAPSTVVKGSTRLMAKGSGLKAMVPKGKTVQILVRDGAGGTSAPYSFIW